MEKITEMRGGPPAEQPAGLPQDEEHAKGYPTQDGKFAVEFTDPRHCTIRVDTRTGACIERAKE